jgi:hypothetical protein
LTRLTRTMGIRHKNSKAANIRSFALENMSLPLLSQFFGCDDTLAKGYLLSSKHTL